jgi:hypothetical protein
MEKLGQSCHPRLVRYLLSPLPKKKVTDLETNGTAILRKGSLARKPAYYWYAGILARTGATIQRLYQKIFTALAAFGELE